MCYLDVKVALRLHLCEHANDDERGHHALVPRLGPGDDEPPRGEEKRGDCRVIYADGDGCKLFPVVVRTLQHLVDVV